MKLLNLTQILPVGLPSAGGAICGECMNLTQILEIISRISTSATVLLYWHFFTSFECRQIFYRIEIRTL